MSRCKLRISLVLLACLVVQPLFAQPVLAQKRPAPRRPLTGLDASRLPSRGDVASLLGRSDSRTLFEGGRVVGFVPLWNTPPASSPAAAPAAAPASGLDVVRSADGTVRWMRGALGTAPVAAGKSTSAAQLADAALSVLQGYASTMRLVDPSEELRLMRAERDRLGNAHVRFEQTHQGIPVWGRDLYVHLDGQGTVYAVNGVYAPTPRGVDLRARLTDAAALDVVVADLTSKGRWAPLPADVARALHVEEPQIRQVIYPSGMLGSRLAYEVSLQANFLERYRYLVDARTGSVLARIEEYCTLDHHAPTSPPAAVKSFSAGRVAAPASIGDFIDATATDLNGVEQTIRTFLANDALYYLFWDFPNLSGLSSLDVPSIGGGFTLDYNDGDQRSIYSFDNSWSDASAVSAHANMKVTFDYFKNTFDRNAINGLDESIISIVHYTENGEPVDNAGWTGRYIVYGDGKEVFKPLAGSLDAAGHEMAHGVINHTANLVYQHQSGALNESFADVFGMMMDRDNYLIGESVVREETGRIALRDMEDPANPLAMRPQPAHMDSFEVLPLTRDKGGVHINSGIPNRAAYLVVQSIGHDAAEQIYYHALSNYLTQTSQFGDARMALQQAAVDLFGEGSAELAAVAAAFDAVGITPETRGEEARGFPVAPVDGEDVIAFVYEDGQIGLLNLATEELVDVDTSLVRASLSTQLSAPRHGNLLFFVNDALQLTRLDLHTGELSVFEDLFIQQPGDLWNVAVAPNGQVVMMASAYADDARLYLSTPEEIIPIELKPETTQEGVFDESILYPDALSWSPQMEVPRVAFDALHALPTDLDTLYYWGAYEIDVASERILHLLPAQPEGIDLGNVTYSSTDPNLFFYNLYEQEAETLRLYRYHAASGDAGEIQIDGVPNPERPTSAPNGQWIAFTTPETKTLWAYDPVNQEVVGEMTFDRAVYNPVWVSVTAGFGVAKEEAGELPERAALLPSYPNPFNPSTTLAFRLPGAQQVELSVYNALGQRVAVLVDGRRPAGEHVVSWDASGQPSGVYFARLSAGGAVQSHKLVLLK